MKNTKAYRLTFTERAREIVAAMTPDEKIRLMAGDETPASSMGGGDYNARPYTAGGCERLGVPKMKFCDGPRGCVSGRSTCFPVTMARGATFDPALEERVGNAIGKEIRANGGNFYGGVCLNVPYHPGAGRSQEVYGEDPRHIAKMGAALVRGIQNQNVIACVKHFAFNSMENARFYVNVTADRRTEREIYLYQFKKCIEAGAAAVMSAYNRYQGHFCGSNPYLLRQVLKGEWDFDGFVISDFFFGTHSTAKCIGAGLDIEMHMRKYFQPAFIKAALKLGKITPEQIDEAALRIVRTLLAFAASEDEGDYPPELIACAEHVALAREVAEKSVTLVKNEELLPLDETVHRRIALVGDLCDTENIGDHGSSMVRPPYVVTLKAAIEKNYPGVKFDYIPTKKVRDFASVVKNADAVLVMAGCAHGDEGEFIFTIGGDRKDLGVHREEVEMIRLAGSLNKNTAVILTGGNMLRVHEWKDAVPAILLAYYPGMEGGSALADILFGRVNPSGRLPFVIGRRDEDFPAMKWNAPHAHYGYYHGYQKLEHDNTPCDYPYGFGLSYTETAITDVQLDHADGKQAVFAVTVENRGDRAGTEVAQLYIGFSGSAVERPVKTLVDFCRVELAPGERKTVLLTAEKEDLAYYDEGKRAFVQEDIDYIAYVGTDEQAAGENPVGFRFGTE